MVHCLISKLRTDTEKGRRCSVAYIVLKSAGVVDGERHGREVVYRLVDEHLSHIVVDAVIHVEEE